MDPIMALVLLFLGCFGLVGWAVWDYFKIQRNQTQYLKNKMGNLNIDTRGAPEHVRKRVSAVNQWLRENPGADLDTAPDFACGGIIDVDGSRLVGEVMNKLNVTPLEPASPVDELRKRGDL